MAVDCWTWASPKLRLRTLFTSYNEKSLFDHLQDESSVAALMEACITDDDKLYLCVSSPTIRDKPVQIRPWRLADADFVLDASMPLDPRKTVFVGGVPRPLKAGEFLNRLVSFSDRYPAWTLQKSAVIKGKRLCFRQDLLLQ